MSEFNDRSEKPSKTQRKKAMLELQELGEKLVGLSRSELGKIPLPDDLRRAIDFAQTLKTHESRRRQLQYIGKIIRFVDPEPIKAALQQLQQHSEKNTVLFHQIEEWRHKLLSNKEEALTAFLAVYPDTNSQHLQRLIKHAEDDRAHHKKTGGETALFKYLRELISR